MVLSIIVPVYNMAADGKLKFCLDSLVAQTIRDYEIIAVDDCSTDDSLKILMDYEQRYPGKFKALHSEVNHHQGGAKNIGLKKATGDWIGFIDADDWITPDMYERLITRAEVTGADVVGCDYSYVYEHTFKAGDPVPNSKRDQIGILDHDKKASLIMDGGSLCVKIFRRSTIIENELFFPEDIFYEDNALSNSYLLTAKRFEYIEEPLYYYYQHDTSTIHSFSEKRCRDRMAAGDIMLKEAKRLGYYDEFKDEIEYKYTLLYFINTLFTYMPCVKPIKISFIKELCNGLKKAFPRFDQNRYYIAKTNPEEKRLISIAMISPKLFVRYYKLLWGYRDLRKKIAANSKKDRVYVCHTFYHAYISVVKELNKPKSERGKATLILSTMSNDFGTFPDRVRRSGLFEEVLMFDEKPDEYFPLVMLFHKDRKNIVLNLLQRIVYTKLLGRAQKKYVPVNFKKYRDIYVFCDSDPIGYYLNYKKIKYHAVEDGLDTIKYCDDARFGNRGHFELKAFLAKLNLIFIENGYSKYCIDMEVNDIACLKYKLENYVEVKRSSLFKGIRDDDRHYLLDIFMEDPEKLLSQIESAPSGKRKVMILSDPVCDLETRKRMMRDIIEEYAKDAVVFIKPHPRDKVDYAEDFKDCIIIKGRFPMEILNEIPQFKMDSVVSILTVVDAIEFAENRVFLGADFMDRYEDPSIHRQNEVI